MHHVLSVGEIYDKAIDLCLRNAGKIALTLGTFCLAINALGVLGMSFSDDRIWAEMHVRPRVPVVHGAWLTVLLNLTYFIAVPVMRGALTVLFDHGLHGRIVSLRECFQSTLGRTVNLIVASFLLDVASVAATIGILAPFFIAFSGVTMLTISGPIVGLSCVLVWLTAPLTIGVAIGFVQVALDAGGVIPSLRIGIANAFAKGSRGRTLGLAVPLVFIFGALIMGGSYGGAKLLGLTNNIAAYVIVQSASEAAALSLLAAVATVCYRNPKPTL